MRQGWSLGALAGLLLACGAPAPAPSSCASTCSGCCDARDTCLADARPRPSGGCYLPDDAGVPSNCTPLALHLFSSTALYVPDRALASALDTFDPDGGVVSVLARLDQGAVVPGSATLAPGTLFTAPWSALLGEGCVTHGFGPTTRRTCERDLGGVGGRVEVGALTGDGDAGTVAVSVTGLTFVELALDAGVVSRVPNGRCVTLAHAAWTARWP